MSVRLVWTMVVIDAVGGKTEEICAATKTWVSMMVVEAEFWVSVLVVAETLAECGPLVNATKTRP